MTIMALLSVQALQNYCNEVMQSHPHHNNRLKCPLPKVLQGKKTAYCHTENKLLFNRDMKGQLLEKESLLWYSCF